MKHIEYLDLEIDYNNRYVRNLNKNYKLCCYFQSDHQQCLKHELHSDQPILNSLIDLLITLGQKLEEKDKDNSNLLYNIRNRLEKIGNTLDDKLGNIEYIKSQNNDLLAQIGEFRIENPNPRSNLKNIQHKILEQVGNKIDSLKNILNEIKQLILS